MQSSVRRWLAVSLAMCLLFSGCKKEVPDEPTDDGSIAASEAARVPFNGMETKDVTFEKIGRFTVPADYVLTQEGSTQKARDSIYYSMYFNNKLQANELNLSQFEQYVTSIAKVSMREYERVSSEELELDGCSAFYVEGRGKDMSKYKYTVFLGVNTPNGLTTVYAVVNDEDWPDKCDIVKDIMYSFKCEGMLDMEELKENLILPEMKPSIVIPPNWTLVNDKDGIKQFKNPSNSIEFTMFFGKQDDMSLERLTKNNPVNWNIKDDERQGYPARTASGQGSTADLSSKTFDIVEVTYQNKRCITVSVIDESKVTDDEKNELFGMMSTISYRERDEDDVPTLHAGEATSTPEVPEDGEAPVDGATSSADSTSGPELTEELLDGALATGLKGQTSGSNAASSTASSQSSSQASSTASSQASSTASSTPPSNVQANGQANSQTEEPAGSSSSASSEISIGGLISFG